jgi:hypothetical protein
VFTARYVLPKNCIYVFCVDLKTQRLFHYTTLVLSTPTHTHTHSHASTRTHPQTCNTCWFSTTTVSWTCLNVTLYVHCLSCITERQRVYCEVRTGFVLIIWMFFRLHSAYSILECTEYRIRDWERPRTSLITGSLQSQAAIGHSFSLLPSRSQTCLQMTCSCA